MKVLFENIEEFRAKSGVSVSTSMEVITPFIHDAQYLFLRPFISEDFLLELLDAFPNLNAEQQKLLPFIQRPLACFAVYKWLPQATVDISNAGVTASRESSAYQWQFKQARDSFAETAYNGLEELLNYLFNNKNDFSTWAGSDEYISRRNLLVNSTWAFNEQVNIGSSAMTYWGLSPIMKRIERAVVESNITLELVDSLRGKIVSDNLSNDEKELLNLIQPVIAHFTISQAILENSVQIKENGAMVYSALATSTANFEESKVGSDKILGEYRKQARKNGEQALIALLKYLNQKTSDQLFPSFKESHNYTGNEPDSPYQPKSTFSLL